VLGRLLGHRHLRLILVAAHACSIASRTDLTFGDRAAADVVCGGMPDSSESKR
jgi:hypothetical protein